MGLSQSCLRAPKTEEFQTPNKGARGLGKDERAAAVSVEPSAAKAAQAYEQKAAFNSDGACCQEKYAVVGTCQKTPTTVDGVHVVHGSLDTDRALETPQISGAFAATATSTGSLQSTFTSTDGFPHSAWELGPPTTDDEQTRVQALRALDILECVSQGRQSKMDEEANMVLGALMQMFNAMTAMLVLFDDTRIIIRNAMGVMKPGEFPYRWSFCAYTLTKHRPQTLVVPDATKDGRFVDNPFVRGAPHVRFYCGAPLVCASGHILGTLCFADNKPRPSFDASQCYLINNMAEIMVRQLERYRANAGPAGPVDAETTALARVARTIECYEATTGLVDISLSEGWMLMYVNEAWEALCSPWSRKQLVGKPLQQLLILEEEHAGEEEEREELEEHHGPDAPQAEEAAAGGGSGGKKRRASAVGAGAAPPDKQQPGLAEAPSVRTTRRAATDIPADAGVVVGRSCSGTSGSAISASGAFGAERNPSVTSNGAAAAGESAVVLAGVVEDGGDDYGVEADDQAPGLVAMPGPERRAWRRRQERRPTAGGAGGLAAWQRHAGALRSGEEVELGRARVMMADGQPSTTVLRVTARSANCHVLDAAVRMPVGVPHHLGLPTSILAAAAEGAGAADGCGGSDLVKSLPAATVAQAAAGVAEAAAAGGDGGDKPEPYYCIVTLTRIEEEGGEQGRLAPAGAAADPAAVADFLASPVSRLSCSSRAPQGGPPAARGGRPSLDTNKSGALGNNVGGRSRGRATAAAGASASVGTRGGSSLRSSASIGFGNWVYGMEPFPGLKLLHLLGKGGYGRVFAASFKGQKVAAKVISNAMLKSATCVNGVTLEALLTQEIEHPYIVRTYKCVVRSYQQAPEWPSYAAGASVRSSATQGIVGYGTAAVGGMGVTTYRSTASLPPATSSLLSALPNGPSDGVGVGRLGSGAAPPSEAGHASDAANASAATNAAEVTDADATGVGCGVPLARAAGSALAASDVTKAAAAVSLQPGPSAAPAPAAAAQPWAAAPPPATAAQVTAAAALQREVQQEDFDSFDVGGDEAVGGGMIDQLTSAAPPVYVPQSAGAGMPSAAAGSLPMAPLPLPLPLHVIAAAPDRLSFAGSGALAQSGPIASAANGMTHGSVLSTAGAASMDQVVATLAAHQGRTPPRVPAGVAGPADPGGAVAASVFSTAAAAAGVVDASFRNSSRAVNEALPEGETWLLQEYCGGGTLQDAIDTGRLRTEPSRLRGKPHMPYILLTAQEVASAMACVHSRGFLHGDLSAVNVLLTDPPAGSCEGEGSGRGWIAKVSDFGLAKHLPDPTQPYVSSAYGVITHCAPEVLKSHAQTQKADVYSFGVLLWQMWTGSRPWANMNRFQIFGAVTGGTSPGLRFLPAQPPPPRYRDLALRCLSPDPASRPTFAEVCEELRIMTYEAASEGHLQ